MTLYWQIRGTQLRPVYFSAWAPRLGTPDTAYAMIASLSQHDALDVTSVGRRNPRAQQRAAEAAGAAVMCRYLIKDRLDRTGARWSPQGAEAVLRLRALRTSVRLLGLSPRPRIAVQPRVPLRRPAATQPATSPEPVEA